MRVALCQMPVTGCKEANIAKAVEMIKTAVQKGADFIVLPECFNCPYGTKYFDSFAEELTPGSPTFDAISQAAKQNVVWIVAGSIPEKCNGKLFNSCMIFDPNGNLKHVHRKVHLYRINSDTIKMDEGEVLTAGDCVLPVSIDEKLKFGVGICFDVRYPPFAWKYANEGTSFLVYPSAFNMVTGPLHWELAARSRAIDNQQFVVMCSPARDTTSEYVAWGHSIVVDPLGNVLAQAEEGEEIVEAELNFDLVESARKKLPILDSMRRDLYSLNWK
ncbi:putative nitrilase [Trypanosoma vivax]|uniref:Nitrilase, putative n=1 Tax=Trypanosoma vivax (strain Y486) TaxID=1055687 RepID=F9WLX0_TRYVY|nr:putative nitrilase [Trypanosoma vivax]CCD18514.1 nitrilase, putative [Trypanosoma vivax Y486]|eukprot:CCD18514.1 nitrilase, putative [Trypanosoma vivax Y486]